MKTFSFFARLRNKRRAFKRDLWHLKVSLALRPRNWEGTSYNGKEVFELENMTEGMTVWIASGSWGIHFTVGNRRYGEVILIGWLVPWRVRLLEQACRAVDEERVNIRHVTL